MTEGALCLQGGAFRGVYTSGVLDVLAENGLMFSAVAGVSAGSMNGLNYVSRQIGRSQRINVGYANDSRYVGARALARSHGMIGFDFLFEDLSTSMDPFDWDTFEASPQRYVAVATSCRTGRTAYLEKGTGISMASAVTASASMPLLSAMVEINGEKYLDGGVSCAVPLGWARAQGYEKIVLVLTRPRGYRKEADNDYAKRLYNIRYQNYPKLAEALCSMNARYNVLCDNMERLEDEGKVFVIQPKNPVMVKRLEHDVDKLSALYNEGRAETLASLDALRSYLKRA